MDDTELHYLTYDPDEMWTEMMAAYIAAGGDVLYPGDEKEILLRGVQYILFLAFAGMDNALRMDTLRYAQGEYLDIYGQKRNCYRMEAKAATATVQITFRASGESKTIPADTPLTADGETLYLLAEDVEQTGYAQTITAEVQCSRLGTAGNALLNGTQMQFLIPQDAVTGVFCTASAAGGQDEEDDDTYRERIREYGLAEVTTGPEEQYRSKAMAVSSVILDAKPLNLGAGSVGVYLLLSDTTGSSTLIAAVQAALSPVDTRPLTDSVTVALATQKPYTLKVKYSVSQGASLGSALTDAVKNYQDWQDKTIGQPFNPDMLLSYLYQAGCTRVIFDTGSNFDGGSVEYTTIAANAYCKGTITLEVIT